jgi:hypothetical protein
MSNILKDDLLALKSKLESIETQLEGQMKELEQREEKWKKMDDQVKDLIKNQNDIVTFNVGGKLFATRISTLLSVKDTLFYKLVLSEKFDLKQEIFFDRSPKLFPFIIDFLRFNKINYKRFNKEELEELRVEAEYFEIGEITSYLDERCKEIEFVKFETSGNYNYNGQTAGTNRIEDLKDRSLMKGICSNSPGWIIIELNSEWEFEELEVGGWNGNSTLWYNANGSGASIQTSTDKVNWKTVGTIPSNYGNTIQNVKLTKSIGKYIKFNHNSYLGIGFLNIKKLS